MKGLLADNDVSGAMESVLWRLRSEEWLEIWTSLGLEVETFETLGLLRNVSDRIVWNTCQDAQLALITGNRNDDGPDSLESTISEQNTTGFLPVFTLANPRRILSDQSYSELVAERLLEYLIEIKEHLGTGRIWLP